MRDIVVLVGNGLLFDLFQQLHVDLSAWHPQNLTRWQSQPKLADGRDLLGVMPRFKAFVAKQKIERPNASDFEHFRTALGVVNTEPLGPYASDAELKAAFERNMIEAEARHFIAGALSYLQDKLISTLPVKDWRWAKWLSRYSERISSIVSLNYDLVLETALGSGDVPFFRYALSEESGYVGIQKPHGSIDFAVNPFDIYYPTLDYPLGNYMRLMNTSVVRMEHLRVPRVHAEIVLPGEHSRIRSFQWVRPGFEHWRRAAKRARYLVIVGLSYWPCDQDELDALVWACSGGVKVYMCNPAPSVFWISDLSRHFGSANIFHSVIPPEFS